MSVTYFSSNCEKRIPAVHSSYSSLFPLLYQIYNGKILPYSKTFGGSLTSSKTLLHCILPALSYSHNHTVSKTETNCWLFPKGTIECLHY
jgi:hypothetical protein